jgi:hypothetical protein
MEIIKAKNKIFASDVKYNEITDYRTNWMLSYATG